VLGNVKRVGASFKSGLERLKTEQPLIQTVRGDGLLLAIDLTVDRAPDVVRHGLAEGVLLNATGPNTLRFAPALTITEAEVQEALEKLKRSLARLDAPEVTTPAAG
jgi:acetylornithine/succinyldiaminopimelate/putrescine aminotransferase